MNRERFEWVASGLARYTLTKSEDLFLKTASADFDENDALTEQQEQRLENLYKEKSKLIPTKRSDLFPDSQTSLKKRRPRTVRGKVT